ncbi:MAG: nucleotide sugar dehydrogenase [Acidimicrobiia bacterium]|nr:nucleotide sugar dehydrogenase [Acidimicrobiia bacterium]
MLAREVHAITAHVDAAVDRFSTKPWTAGVIGLGYVGLPLVVAAMEAGVAAVGFDIDHDRVAGLASGTSHVDDVSDEELRAALDAGLVVTSDESALSEVDAIFVCVPSPLGVNRQPDMSYIEAAAATISRVAHPGVLVSLESTTYPGTTDDIVVPAVEQVGLKVDQDAFVAFSPERVNPGGGIPSARIPKVVGGVSEISGRVAAAAYGRLFASVHPVTHARTAEMTKLLENTYRAVNIALVNEMAQLAHQLDIDIWEVIEAADTKPFGFQAFYPGPGVGGHCIPLDPQFLAWRARQAKFATRFIDTAEQINTAMPRYTADRVADLLNDHGLPLYGTAILGVGIAYKPNVADDRESASIEVLKLLQRRGAEISVVDPVVGTDRIEHWGFTAVSEDSIGSPALAIVLTDHDAIDLSRVADSAAVVFDTRGAYRRRGLSHTNVVTL